MFRTSNRFFFHSSLLNASALSIKHTVSNSPSIKRASTIETPNREPNDKEHLYVSIKNSGTSGSYTQTTTVTDNEMTFTKYSGAGFPIQNLFWSDKKSLQKGLVELTSDKAFEKIVANQNRAPKPLLSALLDCKNIKEMEKLLINNGHTILNDFEHYDPCPAPAPVSSMSSSPPNPPY